MISRRETSSMANSEPVKLEIQGRIAILSLNRPEKLNAINWNVKQYLDKCLSAIGSNGHIRVVVLKGNGKAFCSGGDLHAIKKKESLGRPKDLKYSHTLLKKLMGLEQVVIASVHGFAFGAGCNLALAADLVYAAKGTRFGQSFVRLGLPPDWGGMYILPRLAGMRKAKEWILFGKPFDAEEALAYGLINGIFQEAVLFKNVMALARQLVSGPWTAIRTVKKILNQSPEMDFQEALESEMDAFEQCTSSPDVEEGINAFLEKRTPKFLG